MPRPWSDRQVSRLSERAVPWIEGAALGHTVVARAMCTPMSSIAIVRGMRASCDQPFPCAFAFCVVFQRVS